MTVVQKFRNMINDASATIPMMSVVPWLVPILLSWFILVILWECLTVAKRRYVSRERMHLERFAGPRAYPVIGTVQEMIFTDFYEWSEKMCKRWGDPLRLWRFDHPMVFISSYKYAIQLLSQSNFNGKLQDLDMIHRHPGGKGLSTTPADTHPQRRKMLVPAFSRQIVEANIPVFCEETIQFVKRLERYANSGLAFNVVDHAMPCLFRMVARSDFGDTFMNDQDEVNTEAEAFRHMNALHTIAKNVSARILGPYLWHRNDFLYFNFTKEGIKTKEARDVINSFAMQAIKKRREHLKQMSTCDSVNNTTNKCTDVDPTINQKCYLDILLSLVDRGQMTEGDVVSELNNFMGGAYDTTALTVCWTLLLLALNPLHQERCVEELKEIFSMSPTTNDDHPHLTAAQTKEMKYVELCLKESLRLFPPAPIFPRSTVDDIRLDDGRVIPGGVDVLIFANLIHRDPQHFPDPDAFLPERHSGGSSPAYMPFSLGVRNCIGQTYGIYQAKVVLAYLIMAYEWEAPLEVRNVQDVKIAYQGLLYPEQGINLKIRKRRHNVTKVI